MFLTPYSMSKKSITVFRLAMINLATIISIRNWPVIAEYGFSSVFYFLLAALIFFVPVSLISAELASTWPKIGGIFAWVKEAFGEKLGFLSIWLLWIENALWYPIILSFVASTLAYLFNPDLASNKVFIASFILIIFWGFTFINMLGMKASSWVSTVGVIVGTFIPAAIIIPLGIIWFAQGKSLEISFSAQSFFPKMNSINDLVFFSGVLLSLCGMEMPAVHARDVENPQRNYPKAIGLSAMLVLVLYVLGVLSIAMVVPQKEISLLAGSMQAFEVFLSSFGLKSWLPLIAVLVAFGGLSSISTWIAGPSKGLLAAAQHGAFPPIFRKTNAHGMPTVLLCTQASIVSLIGLLFIFMESVNKTFWVITAIVAQLYLIMYVIMFAAAIHLRYSRPLALRPFKVPGGLFGIWLVGSVGILGCLFAIIIGFYPPEQLGSQKLIPYVLSMLGGVILCCSVPFIIGLFKKESWNTPLPGEKSDNS